jgi:spore germination protein KC
MRSIKIIFLMLLISIFSSGCWNYRELDKLAVVAGVGVDKTPNGQYRVTVELVKLSGGKEITRTSKIITMGGSTVFDAVRNIISLAGNKLYWSHAKVIILSKQVAEDGVTKIMDWYNRDSETRPDVNILISRATTAEEIFNCSSEEGEIKSFKLDDMINNQASLSKAPTTDILKFDIESKNKATSTIIPTIELKNTDGKKTPQIMGTAIIKNDKLIGFLSGEETKALLFIRNEVKGGLLIERAMGKEGRTPVSLEIFKSRTQTTPVLRDNDIEINVKVKTIVAIDELEGSENYFDESGCQRLEQVAGSELKNQVEGIIFKMQSLYAADIFEFGENLRENDPKKWKLVSSNWENIFRNLRVNITTKVQIRNSAMLSKPLEEGD